MLGTRSQRAFTPTNRSPFQAIWRTIVLLLFVAQQSWAGSACLCDVPDAYQPAECHDSTSPISATNHQQETGQNQSHPCMADKADTARLDESISSEPVSSDWPNLTAMCCQASLQPDAEASYARSQTPSPSIGILPSVFIGPSARPVLTAFATSTTHSRPLYLAFSCLLI